MAELDSISHTTALLPYSDLTSLSEPPPVYYIQHHVLKTCKQLLSDSLGKRWTTFEGYFKRRGRSPAEPRGQLKYLTLEGLLSNWHHSRQTGDTISTNVTYQYSLNPSELGSRRCWLCFFHSSSFCVQLLRIVF